MRELPVNSFITNFSTWSRQIRVLKDIYIVITLLEVLKYINLRNDSLGIVLQSKEGKRNTYKLVV